MRYESKLYVPCERWPEEDRRLWEAALAKGDNPFEDSGPAAHLAEASRVSFRDAYARFIAFLKARHGHLLARPAAERLDRGIIADFVKWQPVTTGARTLANNLYWLGLTLRYMCPDRKLVLAPCHQQQNRSSGKTQTRETFPRHRRYSLLARGHADGSRQFRRRARQDHLQAAGALVPQWPSYLCPRCYSVAATGGLLIEDWEASRASWRSVGA